MKFRLKVKFESPFYPVCGVTLRDGKHCPMPVIPLVARDVHERVGEVASVGFDVNAQSLDVLPKHVIPEFNARRLRVRLDDRGDQTSFIFRSLSVRPRNENIES